MKYEEFRNSNPDFQSRVEALTSGLLSPDPKGIALWSMDPGKAYTETEIYDQVHSFCGYDPDLGGFPLTLTGIWGYYYGNPRKGYKGSLEGIGVVVKLEIKKIYNVPVRREEYAIAYQKTDVGEDFGDAIAARGTYLVNKLSKKKNSPNFHSLWRVLSAAQKSKEATQRRGFAVYKIIKLLYQNPKDEFREKDVVEETGLSQHVCFKVLNSLGKAGIIDYKSPQRDVKGGRAKSWAKYRANHSIFQKGIEQVCQEVKKKNHIFVKDAFLVS